jgi:hypothetical protein
MQAAVSPPSSVLGISEILKSQELLFFDYSFLTPPPQQIIKK